MSHTHRAPLGALAACGAAAVVAAVTALTLSGGSATASVEADADAEVGAAAGSAPEAELKLSIVPENPTDDNRPTTVTLECGPAGGTYPEPKLGCGRLFEVDGVFEDLEWSGACLEYWDPVTISATGTWYGRDIDFVDEHSNRMCASAATNRLFSF